MLGNASPLDHIPCFPDAKRGYVIFGASVKGECHKETECQDSFTWTVRNGLLIVAVSDGAGSSKQSRLGADTAVKSAVSAIENVSGKGFDLEELAQNSVYSARETLERKSSELGVELGELACTLVVVVASGDQFSVAHIGDGAVIIVTESGLEVFSEPERSEYVNETTFLTSDQWRTTLRTKTRKACSLAIFTDGIQRGVLIKENQEYVPCNEFFDPLFDYACKVTVEEIASEEVSRLLRSDKFSKLSDDDKTLVVVTRRDGSPRL
jgi:hypothetical protein